jgi:hypothetical protein
MPSLHRPIDDRDLSNYPLKRIVIELQAPKTATVNDMLQDLDEIADRLRNGETDFAAEALFGYRVAVGRAWRLSSMKARVAAKPHRPLEYAQRSIPLRHHSSLRAVHDCLLRSPRR